jgi:hypothetical protein
MPDDIAYLLTASILCSDNSASNWLMQYSGDDSMGDGLNDVSCTAQALGAESSTLAAYRRAVAPPLRGAGLVNRRG